MRTLLRVETKVKTKRAKGFKKMKRSNYHQLKDVGRELGGARVWRFHARERLPNDQKDVSSSERDRRGSSSDPVYYVMFIIVFCSFDGTRPPRTTTPQPSR